jgi:hypothetical protein
MRFCPTYQIKYPVYTERNIFFTFILILLYLSFHFGLLCFCFYLLFLPSSASLLLPFGQLPLLYCHFISLLILASFFVVFSSIFSTPVHPLSQNFLPSCSLHSPSPYIFPRCLSPFSDTVSCWSSQTPCSGPLYLY